MKKFAMFMLTAAIAASISSTASAAEIPRESAPANATEESIVIAENLISGILDEVQNGLGYQPAWSKANNAIFSAVLAKQTNGYGYSDLAAISRNAILQYRDMYLRPEYYAEKENTVKAMIADLITDVQSGTKDYTTARNEASSLSIRSVSAFTPPMSSTAVKYFSFLKKDILLCLSASSASVGVCTLPIFKVLR